MFRPVSSSSSSSSSASWVVSVPVCIECTLYRTSITLMLLVCCLFARCAQISVASLNVLHHLFIIYVVFVAGLFRLRYQTANHTSDNIETSIASFLWPRQCFSSDVFLSVFLRITSHCSATVTRRCIVQCVSAFNRVFAVWFSKRCNSVDHSIIRFTRRICAIYTYGNRTKSNKINMISLYFSVCLSL